MKLNYKEFGSGRPMIILHGLLGSLDNWQSLARRYGEKFHVFSVDQRNHGQSPHSDEMTFEAMVQDLLEFIQDHNIEKPVLLGHSMGGKTAMAFAFKHPELISGLIVADISPKTYKVHHREILDALTSVDFATVKDRRTVEDQLMLRLGDRSVVLFLAKNVYWKQDGKLAYRFNLNAIDKNIEAISAWPFRYEIYSGNTLFIKGDQSNYIRDDDPSIGQHFPNSRIMTIHGAGHWVHAEKPDDMYRVVYQYMMS
ncbi:MAG: alpha/beta fold hydrolase [Vicingaceae bacterium]